MESMRRWTMCLAGPSALWALVSCSSATGIVGVQDGGDGATHVLDGQPGFDVPAVDAVPPGDGPVNVSDAGVAVHDPDGTAWTCYPTTCRNHRLACGDCTDNDGDGLIDSHDPECLGPCSNSEGPTLFPDVGGGNSNACTLNCYFNFGVGSGQGEGGCTWDHHCDPHEVAPAFDPQGDHCAYQASSVGGRTCPASQSALCLDTCEPLTPNGCDCFGCCTFDAIHDRPDASGGAWVYLGSMDGNTPTCDYAHVADTTRCRPCQPVANCMNPCDGCEVCVGERTPDPSRCPAVTPVDGGVTPTDAGAPVDGGGLPGQCAAGIQPCGLEGEMPCAQGTYCITGCCIAAPQ